MSDTNKVDIKTREELLDAVIRYALDWDSKKIQAYYDGALAFNPLESWDDCFNILVAAMRKKGFRLILRASLVTAPRSSAVNFWTMRDGQPFYYLEIHADARVAICLAALAASDVKGKWEVE